MNNKEKLIDTIITGFQSNKGKSSFYCFNKKIVPEIIYSVIYRFIAKHSNIPIFIVVDSYYTRKSILDYINEKEITANITCMNADFIKDKYKYNYMLSILVGINDDFNVISKISTDSKFTMCILTNNVMNNDFINNVRKILPNIDTAKFDNKIKLDNICSPVEEYRYGIDLSEEDTNSYNKYTDYINTSISVFEELDNIEKCRKGDTKLNISAVEFRNELAKKNGWSENLDMSIDFMRQIDDIYNPNTLLERANNFYTIAKNRRDLCCNNINKFNIIKEILEENIDKKILIVSKSGEYAAAITNYINTETEFTCKDYHDSIKDAVAIDENGNPLFIKTGINKGNVKIIGSQAQSTANQALYNNNIINILSIKNASNTKLKIACDVVILTTSLFFNIVSVKQRFTNVSFNNNLLKVYRIYCNDTIEQQQLYKEKNYPFINIIDKTENFIEYDKNSNCIIL